MTRNIINCSVVVIFSLASAWLVPSSSLADTVLLFEDFESLALGSSVDEEIPADNVWTKTPPSGWSIDDSGVFGINDAGVGVTEWKGWSFANREWWANTAGDQRRSEFTLGTGTVAISDPDEWDDIGDPDGSGTLTSFLTTKPISLTGIQANTVEITFDSAWRQEATQEATLSVSYDGGAEIEIFRWSYEGANFKADAVNETVNFPLNNPAGASNMEITFGMNDAHNDWYWAVDNISVTGVPEPASIILAAFGLLGLIGYGLRRRSS